MEDVFIHGVDRTSMNKYREYRLSLSNFSTLQFELRFQRKLGV